MTQRNWPWEAKQLLPHLTTLLGAGVTVQAGGGALVAHALNSSWHSGTLAESQAPWAVTQTTYDAHVANANAHHAKLHNINDSANHTLPLNWGNLSKVGSDLADLETRTPGRLDGTGGALYDVVGWTGAGVIGRLTPSADVSAEASGGSLLRSAAGALTLKTLTAATKVRTSLLDTASGDMTLQPAGDLVLNPGGADVTVPVATALRSTNYAAGFPLTGFRIGQTSVAGQSGLNIGVLEADEMRARVFVADETRVDRGQQYITKSYGVLSRAFTAPASVGGTAYLYVENSPHIAGAVFTANDWVLLRYLDMSSGIALTSVWGQVSAYDVTGLTGEQRWTFTLRQGTGGLAFGRGALAVNFGASGQPYILSDAVSATAPYIQIGKWTTNPYTPANRAVLTQVGALDGLGFTGELGLAAAVDNFTDAGVWLKTSTGGAKLNNVALEWWTGGAKFAWANVTEGFGLRVSTAYQDRRSYSFSNASGVFGGMSALYGENVQVVGITNTAVGLRAQTSLGAQSSATFGATVNLIASQGELNSTLSLVVGGGNGSFSVTLPGTQSLILDGVNHTAALSGLSLSVDGAIVAYGGVSSTTGTFSSAVSGTAATFSSYGSFAGALFASNEALAMSIGSPYYGFSVKAPSGSWARGHVFHTASNVTLGGFGAYGSGDVLGYFWIGNAYNDYVLHINPATDAVTGTGNWSTSGSISCQGGFQRSGVAGGIFVPMTPTNLTDTGSTVWSGTGVSRAAGTYTFDVNIAANGSVPTDAIAVAVMATFTWTNSSNSTYATIQKPSAAYSIVARALGSAIASDVAGDVMLDSNGQFTVTIVNATSNTTLLRIVGYYI